MFFLIDVQFPNGGVLNADKIGYKRLIAANKQKNRKCFMDGKTLIFQGQRYLVLEQLILKIPKMAVF